MKQMLIHNNLPEEILYKGKNLFICGIPYNRILLHSPTPVIIFSKKTLLRNIHEIKEAFTKHIPHTKIHYALKASYLKEVCSVVRSEGLGVEILSDVEYALSKKYGFDNSQIIFNGSAKLDRELKAVIRNGIWCINCDSLSEIKRVNRFAKSLGKVVDIGLRVHPNIRSNSLFVNRGEKLGIDILSNEAAKLARITKSMANVRLKGINCHILANEVSPENHYRVTKEMCKFYNNTKKIVDTLEFIDIGGGYNSNYLIKRNMSSMDLFAKKIAQALSESKFDGTLIIEPGRYIVNDAFSILTQVVTRKVSVNNLWIMVDAGTNILIPTKHNRFYLTPCVKRNVFEKINIGDGIGSTSGVIARNQVIPKIYENEFALILNCGAYTLTMSENFVYLKPKVIMVQGNRIKTIRPGTSLREFLNNVY